MNQNACAHAWCCSLEGLEVEYWWGLYLAHGSIGLIVMVMMALHVVIAIFRCAAASALHLLQSADSGCARMQWLDGLELRGVTHEIL
jgi:hypothetical protein